MDYLDTNRRHDFVLLFDVTDGNPNGDPDAGNMPRVDPETMQGIVTDVALKRKVRDWVDAAYGTQPSYKIYVQSDMALNAKHKRAYHAEGLTSTGTKQALEDIAKARTWMCQNFYDIRLFGAVMNTSINCGQVRGPVQLTFARSIDQVAPLEITVTRHAITREEDFKVVTGENGETRGKQVEIGRKFIIPYGLYRAHGFFNPHFARQSGITEDDISVFWKALQQMWDFDRTSTRGMLSCQGLYIFSHESSLGNTPAQELFNRISVQARSGTKVLRSIKDYTVSVDESLPKEVVLSRLVG